MRRLIDEQDGNPLVRKTLTCLERELNGSQATVPEPSDSEDDEAAPRGPTMQLDEPPAFVGAVESTLPLDPAAYNDSLSRYL